MEEAGLREAQTNRPLVLMRQNFQSESPRIWPYLWMFSSCKLTGVLLLTSVGYVFSLLILSILAAPRGLWDLSSPARD